MAEVEVTLTKEMEERLALCAPITVRNEFPYVPMVYREAYPDDPKKWPVFTLKAIGGVDHLKAQDLFSNTGGQMGVFALEILKGRVVSWKNYSGADGKPVPFDESLQPLPAVLLQELATAILKPAENKLSEEEVASLG